MAEFGLAAVLLLALGLGTVEISHWMSVRQALSLALIQAARIGTVAHGNPERIAEGFEQALLPLFPPAASAAQNLQAHLLTVRSELQQPPWRIAVLSPHPGAYLDFDPPSNPKTSAFGPQAAAANPSDSPSRFIDNDYQALQHQRYLARYQPEGRGPNSGQTIYEANTLTLALVYPHRPLLPTTRALLRLLPGSSTSYSALALSQGYLPMSRQVSLIMQSHPALWTSLASGKVSIAQHTALHRPAPDTCTLCPYDSGTPPPTGQPSEPPTAVETPTPPAEWNPPNGDTPGGFDPLPETSDPTAPTPEAELCGVVLCCTE